MSDVRKGRKGAPPDGEPTAGTAPAGPAGAGVPVDAGPAEPVPTAAAGETGAGEAAVGEAAAGEAANGETAALKDRWLRAEAELQNFRRRAARDREESRRGAEEGVMLEILAALDDLGRALASVPADGAPAPWAEGVRMVERRLVEYLARQGVSPVDPLGQAFDPAFHEAVLEMPVADAAPGEVTQVVMRGWRRGERALRAARVVVARAPDAGGAG